jgi:L-threonylcarbamoyladenylate synthase
MYKLKKRSRKKPLILLGYNWNALKRFIHVEACHGMPLRKYTKQWPGPLTIILPASKKVPKFLNKGFKTIGVRVPNNKFLLNLLKRCPGKVLASTSANISGRKNVQPIAKKVKLFIKAKRGEMSFRPSRIVGITKRGVKRLR